MKTEKSKYDRQAEEFLFKYQIQMRVKWLDNKKPTWWKFDSFTSDHYKVILEKVDNIIMFNFWTSTYHNIPSEYDILACISSEATDNYRNFKEFCDNLGYNYDSIKDYKQYKSWRRHNRKLRRFFNDEEIKELSKIQ